MSANHPRTLIGARSTLKVNDPDSSSSSRDHDMTGNAVVFCKHNKRVAMETKATQHLKTNKKEFDAGITKCIRHFRKKYTHTYVRTYLVSICYNAVESASALAQKSRFEEL